MPDVACPECGARVPVLAVMSDGADGTTDKIRCGRCDHRFVPRRDEPAAASGGAAPSPEDAPAESAGPKPRPSSRTDSSAARKRQKQKKRLAGPSGTLAAAGRPGGVPRKIGPYEVVQEIARGGMGVVYRGKQAGLKRDVAIKVLRHGEGATGEEIQRFRREAEAAARLQHSNIVPIHAVGLHEGQHYFVMDFIEGRTVADRLRDGPLSPREALDITEQCAEALHYAHLQGVIHRDMKPANVIIDRFGRPQIMDFGLAKRIDEETRLTQTGTTMGTPAYMPPEQAEGDLAAIDSQSDVYALGAVLYEMLTGRPPFEGSSTMNILMKVLEEDPRPPREINPRIHKDIETICLKAMEKEKIRRYRSALELAEDIRRFEAGEVISAAPAGLLYRLRRKAAKNPLSAAVLLVAPALLVGTLGYLGATRHLEAVAEAAARAARINSALESGNRLLKEGRVLAADGKVELAEEKFSEAGGDFRRALDEQPNHPAARRGEKEARREDDLLKAAFFLGKAEKYLAQENFEAAADMFAVVLKVYAPGDSAAKAGLRQARGLGRLTLTTVPAGATVYLLPERELAARSARSLGERIGVTPIRGIDIDRGRYKLTVRREGYGLVELTLVVGRSEEVVLQDVDLIDAGVVRGGGAKADNTIRVPAGDVLAASGHTLTVPAFFVDRYEFPNRWGEMPLTDVSWVQAQARCNDHGKRLCSAAEWQRACAGSDGRKWPYGATFEPARCRSGRSGLIEGAVRSGMMHRCVSPFGLYDMSGNVAEWVTRSDGEGTTMGGHWNQSLGLSVSCHATLYYRKEEPSPNVGFRCCWSAGTAGRPTGK